MRFNRMNFKNKILQNKLLKITSVNSPVVLIRLFVSFFSQRLIALYFKETGVALVAQLRDLNQMLINVSSFGQFNAVLKYLSENKESPTYLKKLFSTVTIVSLISSLLISLTLIFSANYFSNLVFKSSEFSFLIKLIGLLVPFMGMSRLFQAIINANSHYKIYSRIELTTYVFSTIGIFIFIYMQFLPGVLFAVALTPLVQFLVIALTYFTNLKAIFFEINFNIDFGMFKSIIPYSLMSFTSVFFVSYVSIHLRSKITTEISVEGAGLWSAMTNISRSYMMFSSLIFTMYVIPKFSKIYSRKEFFKEMRFIYLSILPIFLLGMVLIYFLRDFIINILYPNFNGLDKLFVWQLLGDFVKLAATIVAHQFIAKKMTKSFIFSELFSVISFFVLSLVFINYYGVQGILISHLIRYILYFILVVVLVNRYFSKNNITSN